MLADCAGMVRAPQRTITRSVDEMTEPGELDLMSLCVTAGREISPCGCDGAMCDMCVGTGVMPATLQLLYKLATDIADMVEKEERAAISHVLHVESVYKNGGDN